MSASQVPCTQCAQPIPAAAAKCFHCGSEQAPDLPGFTERPVFKTVGWLASLITSVTVIFGVVSYVGGLVPRSDTRVSDISPDGTSWYVGYENTGNATARFGSLVVTQIYPEKTGGAAGARTYLPLEFIGAADALFIAPGSSRAIQIPFEADAEQPEGTTCELRVELFEHGQKEPRRLLFRRACPDENARGAFERPEAQELTDH